MTKALKLDAKEQKHENLIKSAEIYNAITSFFYKDTKKSCNSRSSSKNISLCKACTDLVMYYVNIFSYMHPTI